MNNSAHFSCERSQSLTVAREDWGTWRVTSDRGSVIHASGLSFDEASRLAERLNRVAEMVPQMSAALIYAFATGTPAELAEALTDELISIGGDASDEEGGHPSIHGAKHTRLGSELTPEDRAYVLAAFVHRFTRENKPEWVTRCERRDGSPYPVQFASDAEWLAHTRFATTAAGRLDMRFTECESSPTWPENPELRRAAS